MPSVDQQLASDHQKVLDAIRLYRNINLISTSGEPPDEYDIEYRVRGYSETAGGIKIIPQHRIKIKLPFGYPHFPPTIKPLNSIFHPDIDSNVVRIADYWESNRSLADLVVYLGEMICGKFYSSDNPFNQKAADYYAKHDKDLPLDSLKLVKDVKDIVIDKPPFEYHIPLLRMLVALFILALLSCAGFFLFEKNKLGRVQAILEKAQILVEDQEYVKAHTIALSANADLDKFYLLLSARDTLRTRINSFLQSKSLQEGLDGKILFEGEYIDIDLVHKLELLKPLIKKAEDYSAEGNTTEAIEAYKNALDYANSQKIVAEIDPIRRSLAKLQVQQFIAVSEKAHSSKDLRLAIAAHKKVLAYIDDEQEFLPEEAQQQAIKTRELLTRDQITLYTQEALQAEEQGDLETALENYNAQIDFIGKAGPRSQSTLKNILLESMQKAAQLTEKITILEKQRWLEEYFKDIFPNYYPAVLAATLHNPQAVFVRYEGKNLIYDLSCLEKSQGSIVRLRIYYQYNPETNEWTLFEGEP